MSEPEEELFIEQIEMGPMQNFVYVVGSTITREVALVDPAWGGRYRSHWRRHHHRYRDIHSGQG